jgi:hypothetical protein
MNIIFAIHLILFSALFIVPFRNNEKHLQFYSILIPFLFYHWSVNDDTCALTQFEMYMTGENKDETFMGRLVGPIYKMSDTAANNMLKTLLFTLWGFTQYRLGHFEWIEENLRQRMKLFTK